MEPDEDLQFASAPPPSPMMRFETFAHVMCERGGAAAVADRYTIPEIIDIWLRLLENPLSVSDVKTVLTHIVRAASKGSELLPPVSTATRLTHPQVVVIPPRTEAPTDTRRSRGHV